NNNFDFSFVGWDKLVFALLRVTVIVALGIIAAFTLGRRFFETSVMKKIILTDTMKSTTAFTDSPKKLIALILQTGTALTNLRPAGAVNVNGEQYDAVGEGGFIHKGDTVRVTEIRGNYLVVRKSE